MRLSRAVSEPRRTWVTWRCTAPSGVPAGSVSVLPDDVAAVPLISAPPAAGAPTTTSSTASA
jgi:hypothetical protein